jgi:uncharacterized membrane protein
MPSFLSLNNLRPYFEVSSKQLIKRVGLAMIPFSQKFMTDYNAKPDLYGPFWVLTTLICTLFISSNLYCYIMFNQKDDESSSGITFRAIPTAAAVIYGVGIGLPLLMKLLLSFYGTGAQQQPEGNRHVTYI